MLNKDKLLIDLESLDSGGKSTQVKLIKEYFENQGKKVKHIHFPMYGYSDFSEMIAKFLRGEYGNNDEVDPIFVANIYAMDRYMYKNQLLKDIEEYDVVIMDRYVFSNMAYQGAKIKDRVERNSLIWQIQNLEFDFFKLPYPDLVLFFDIPINEIENRLNTERVGDDRNYLEGKKDIHEKDINFQSNVRDIYFELKIMKNFHIIDGYNKEGILNTTDLFGSYEKLLKFNNIDWSDLKNIPEKEIDKLKKLIIRKNFKNQ